MKFKLTLTDEDCVILNEWTINTVYDFDVENLDSKPVCDYYYVQGSKTNSIERCIGKEITKELDIEINHPDEPKKGETPL